LLEGATWDYQDTGCLCEPKVLDLEQPMPPVLFRPVVLPSKKKPAAEVYRCPLYVSGRDVRQPWELPLATVELPPGKVDNLHWTLRETALLLLPLAKTPLPEH
jgi:Dynein heavy chain C-terminal domain